MTGVLQELISGYGINKKLSTIVKNMRKRYGQLFK